MRRLHKVLLNTGTLYFKIIISVIVTLFSTRIALDVLGVDSFGLYNLIAGIIILLSFLNSASLISVQRFLSIAIGEKNIMKMEAIFNGSLQIHFVLALILIFILLMVKPVLFNHVLQIKTELIPEAMGIYNIMIASAFVTLFSIPYSAAINAREDMWLFAITDIIVTLLKLLAAVALLWLKHDLLLMYTFGMFMALLIGTIMKIIWCSIRYKECHIRFFFVEKLLLLEMAGFAGWNTLASFAVLIRNQGVAVLLNIFFGTVINATYGIANQLNSLTLSFSSTLTSVFTPIIIQTKGQGNESKMLELAVISSKISFLISSIIVLPLLLFTPFILHVWLHRVPQYSIEFCRLVMLLFLVLQLYPGLTRSLYAAGNIRQYQIYVSLLLICILPLGYLLFQLTYIPYYILILMIILQSVILIVTVYMSQKINHLDVWIFVKKAIIIPLLLLSLVLGIGVVLRCIINWRNEWSETIFISLFLMILYLITYMYWAFSRKEKEMFLQLIKR
ncbi:hypothetical protein [Phocaeicola sp.]